MTNHKQKQMKVFQSYTTQQVLALAVKVYEDQGFIRSGEGFVKYNNNGELVSTTEDNKTRVMNMMVENINASDNHQENAKTIMDKFNGKFMLKKLTGKLTSFEQSVAKAFSEDLNKFHVAVIASIPHMNKVDEKRQVVEDKIEQLRFVSEYFGNLRVRYDITVSVLDVKFIQSSGTYIVTTIYNNKDIIKFWWRDQPDLSDIIDGKNIRIRGTVIKHEKSKYTNAYETMMNRVKILENDNG